MASGSTPSYSAVLSPTAALSSSSHGLSASISSLSSASSARHSSSSNISRAYRQASTLFLTRRLPEALSTVLPLITPPPSDDPNGGASFEPAPVARASRATRIKVWSLYLTVLNAILELDADEGKEAFGTQEWRALCTKVRDGEVWEEVVHNGYHGVEGDVDADVVINLATLLLAHAKTQILNQKRLENYLAAARTPDLDISDRFSTSGTPRRLRSPAKGAAAGGADTPRDLNARVKILELYTLHVLLRNNEWEYARDFISMSPVLDEERREAFLQALQSLHEEQHEAERHEKEERQRREDALRRDMEEARRLRAENEERERKRLEEERVRREGSEIDYGIERSPSQAGSSSGKGASRRSKSTARPLPATKKVVKAAVAAPLPTPAASLGSRASMALTSVRAVAQRLALSFQANPFAVYRALAFVVGLLLMLSRKGIREKVARVLGTGWGKVRATAGMGVKVSYI
ncbi:peroxin 26 [Podospora appendiculata]|uniref:Peroxin 26 n=1 Tax=Podospora appendiculata TaxID=314037 RepID=A0AAE0XGZ0_9PEZI|nr:peroxin 26 [Podospora appendiculata]